MKTGSETHNLPVILDGGQTVSPAPAAGQREVAAGKALGGHGDWILSGFSWPPASYLHLTKLYNTTDAIPRSKDPAWAAANRSPSLGRCGVHL